MVPVPQTLMLIVSSEAFDLYNNTEFGGRGGVGKGKYKKSNCHNLSVRL